jgi:hypothetical protein
MKFSNKITLLASALTLCASVAKAQIGFDAYGTLNGSLVVEAPRILDGGSATFTNNPVDIRMYEGTVKLDIYSCTNAGGALTVTPYTSPDKTNWTALANYSLAQSSTFLYTNSSYGGTNLIGTNVYNMPGVLVAPTAATAGFATPYIDNSSPFTNSGALTITAKKFYTIGFNADDATGRFLQLVWTPTGSSSNDIVGAVLTGRRKLTP